jgi:hypothetical protein
MQAELDATRSRAAEAAATATARAGELTAALAEAAFAREEAKKADDLAAALRAEVEAGAARVAGLEQALLDRDSLVEQALREAAQSRSDRDAAQARETETERQTTERLARVSLELQSSLATAQGQVLRANEADEQAAMLRTVLETARAETQVARDQAAALERALHAQLGQSRAEASASKATIARLEQNLRAIEHSRAWKLLQRFRRVVGG